MHVFVAASAIDDVQKAALLCLFYLSVSLLFHPKMPCIHQNVGAESHTKQPFSQRRRVTMEYYKMKGQMNSCIVAGTLKISV